MKFVFFTLMLYAIRMYVEKLMIIKKTKGSINSVFTVSFIKTAWQFDIIPCFYTQKNIVIIFSIYN